MTNSLIASATPELAWDVALRMRESDYREIVCTTRCRDRRELADYLSQQIELAAGPALPGKAWCIGIERPIAILSLHSPWPGFGTVGMFATDDWPRVWRSAVKLARRVITPAAIDMGLWRAEALSLADHHDAHAFLRAVGLQQADRALPAFGRDGEDMTIFEWLRDDGHVHGRRALAGRGTASGGSTEAGGGRSQGRSGAGTSRRGRAPAAA